MCHSALLDSRFVDFLVRADRELAAETRAIGCVRCGNALHRNNFPRKPRGIPAELVEHFNYRLSFDCAACGKRHTPPSVRFFERRVYAAFAVVLSCAVRSGLTGFRVKALNQWIVVPRRTLERWRLWWSEIFARSAFFKAARGRFRPGVIEDATLPRCLLNSFEGPDLSARLQQFLRFVVPLSGRH